MGTRRASRCPEVSTAALAAFRQAPAQARRHAPGLVAREEMGWRRSAAVTRMPLPLFSAAPSRNRTWALRSAP